MNTAFAIRPAESKGRGLFSLKDFSAGDLIHRDTSVLKAGPFPSRALVVWKLTELVCANDEYFALLCGEDHEGSREAKALDKVKSNAFLDSLSNGQFLGTLYLLFSLGNHSCRPNVVIYKGSMFAVCAVAAGEELCYSYKPSLLFQSATQRQQITRALWHFDCRCPRCLRPPPSDQLLTDARGSWPQDRVERMKQLYDSIIGTGLVTDKAWYERAKKFLKLDLGPCHWRKYMVRKELIPFAAGAEPDYAKQLLEEQIASCARIDPCLSLYSKSYFDTYHFVCGKLGVAKNEIERSLRALDANYDASTSLASKASAMDA